jgi:hypothetical protein
MHPQLSPLAAQIRFEQIVAAHRFHHRISVNAIGDERRRRRFGRRPPPGTPIAHVVALPSADRRPDPVAADRRVA